MVESERKRGLNPFAENNPLVGQSHFNFQHFIPIEEDLSDLREKIEWARKNDEKARQIALNANALAAQWMNPEFMYCYYAKTIELYRLNYPFSSLFDQKLQ